MRPEVAPECCVVDLRICSGQSPFSFSFCNGGIQVEDQRTVICDAWVSIQLRYVFAEAIPHNYQVQGVTCFVCSSLYQLG